MSMRAAPPIRMAEPMTPPAAQLPPPNSSWVRTASSPGRISEKAHAASMTPAPKPNRVSCVRSDRRWDSITGTVPSAVASAAAEPPARAWKTTGWFWA